MRNLRILFNTYHLEISWHISLKLSLRISFGKQGLQMTSSMWSNYLSWIFSLVCQCLIEMRTSTEAMNLKFERDKFGARTGGNLHTRLFQKSHVTKVVKSLTNFTYQRTFPMEVSTLCPVRNTIIGTQSPSMKTTLTR